MNKIDIHIDFNPNDHYKMGTLTHVDGEIYFKYDQNFLKRNINPSPFKIQFNDNIQKCPKIPFDNLFGVFNDSLPDAWGKLIVDRHLLSDNNNPDLFSPLQRLSLVGIDGLGALTYHPSQDNLQTSNTLIKLNDYAQQAVKLLAGKETKISNEFYRLTGTSGGARPKIQVVFNTTNFEIKAANNFENNDESFWIIKFPSIYDLPDIAQIEYAYYLMAKDAKINMSECRLFEGEKGEKYFGTKRFDRIGNQKLHFHSLAGLLHDDFKKSSLDYGHIIDAVVHLEKNKSSIEKVMRLAIFNVLTFNQDDHSKNFSFLMDNKGFWEFSPAYDLTFSPHVYGFQTTSVASIQQNITLKDFEKLAQHFSFRNTLNIWNEIKSIVCEWERYAKLAGVTDSSIQRIKSHLKV